MDDGYMTTFGMVAIVRNEAARIDACLTAAYAAGVRVVTLVDTGSTDRTVAIAKVCAKRLGFKLRTFAIPYEGQGKSRTFAFAKARGTADWLFALDADMVVTVDRGWVPDPAVDAYGVELGGGGSTWRLPLVLRGDVLFDSHGRYHEWTGRADSLPIVSLPTDAVRITMPNAAPTTPEKLRWQLSLIEADLADDPTNARWQFYVAQINRDLGNHDAARVAYRLRAAMGGWIEEASYAAYQAALLAPDWDTRASELMAAWQMHPTRLEALQALCRELNARGMHEAAYRLAAIPTTPAPVGPMFVDGASWTYGMKFERSIAAWWTGHQDECRTLGEELLLREDLPADVRAAIERNLTLCGPKVA